MKSTIFSIFALAVTATSSYAEQLSSEALYCLQQNVFFEARNQGIMGKTAVAWVTLNRVKSSKYPDDICSVVFQNKQFSWTHDGKSDTPSDNVIEQKAWEMSGLVARVAYDYWSEDFEGPIEQSVMFHADYVDPYWKSSYTKVAQIGDHIFYK